MLGVALDFKNYPDTTTPYTATNMNNMQKLLVNLIYPIGIYVEISDIDFDPNTAWGGTWELETDGTTLVSKSSASSSKFNDEIGTIIGEEEHTLTINEIPAHKHKLSLADYASDNCSAVVWKSGNANGKFAYDGDMIDNAGGNQPHNNVQPSKIVNRWHRIA